MLPAASGNPPKLIFSVSDVKQVFKTTKNKYFLT